MGLLKTTAIVIAIIASAAIYFPIPSVLKGLNSNHDHSPLEMQAIVTAFCLSPVVGTLLGERSDREETVNANKGVVGGEGTTGGDFLFEEDGDIENDEYAQSSIYAVLYALYKNAGDIVSDHGVMYQFTFNTWGFAPSAYPEEDPERYGKTAYAGLVTQPAAKAYMKKLPAGQKVEIVEIGCGTGAGANLITREVLKDQVNYLALDMQQAAINTCNEKYWHATENPNLTCQVVLDGVGNNGNPVPREDSSVDFVIISETHIADIVIGDLEKAIFAEIKRILKPGGLFLWGNALPTRVWEEADIFLPTLGFKLENNFNHTKGAVIARDEDYERVELVMSQLTAPYPVMTLPYFGERCKKVSNRLIANFYRHPGTALYLKMVTGFDSYMHQAWINSKKM
jgi:SAM-dependent methyltransferase